MARYRPQHIQQKLKQSGRLIGCTDTEAALMVDYSTLGKRTCTEARVRLLSDETRPDPNSPGLNLFQIDRVMQKLGIPFDNRTGDSWGDVIRAVDGGRMVLAQLWYSAIGGTPIGHAVGLLDIRDGGVGRDLLVDDPRRATGARWMPAEKVKDGMEIFARRTGLQAGLRFGVSRDIT